MNFNRNLLAATILGASLAVGCTAFTEKTVGENVTDAAILTKAKTAMTVDPITKARNIDIDVIKGEVTLNGLVNSPEEARRAEQLVRQLEGVRSVRNNLRLTQR